MNQLNPALFTSIDDYQLARQESEKLDLEFGFEVEQIEGELLARAQELDPAGNHKTWGTSLHQGNQTWVGLSHQTLQTPYSELKKMCELIDPKALETIVDLGAGYGRMGLVLAALYPRVNFIGYEYVASRVSEGCRILEKFECQRAQLLVQDLTSPEFILPEAEYYFVYDYGTVQHIRQTLKQIEKMADQRKFKVIARGKGTRSLIQYEHPWLADVYPAIHEENFSIFQFADNHSQGDVADPG
jgi:hypothetical protein